jgi:hypothetical protein
MGHGQRHAVARRGGGGMGPVWRSGGTAWPVVAQSRCSRVVHAQAARDQWPPTTVPGSGGLNILQIQMNSNYFKTFQI